MRVLVCGGRGYTDYTKVCEVLNGIWEAYGKPLTIIEGGARGADSLARVWSKANPSTVIETYPADWSTYGKSAGYIRNSQMLKEGKPDLVVAFPGGVGTAMMVKIAKLAGVEVIEVEND
jgi:hypothetical protein